MRRTDYPKAVSKSKRWIYEIADHDRKIVYIGLTCNPRKRFDQHRKNPTMIANFEIQINPTIITGLMSVEKAKAVEASFIDYFKLIGYRVLNKAKAGSVGSPDIYWTFDLCQLAASRYTTRKDFGTNEMNAYAATVRNNWLDDVCGHMVSPDRTIRLTFDFCQNEARRFTSRAAFAEHSNSAYTKCRKLGWLEEVCSHMVRARKPHGFWNLATCRESAANFNTLRDFRNNANTAYAFAARNGWLDVICSHMVPLTNRTYRRRLTPVAA
jgi:predicted GIY-YIG superfamily endonuclease